MRMEIRASCTSSAEASQARHVEFRAKRPPVFGPPRSTVTRKAPSTILAVAPTTIVALAVWVPRPRTP